MAMIISSCQKEEEISGTSVEAMAGQWFLKLSEDSGKTYNDDYYHISTFNTAANSSTEMWLDDHGEFYEFKGKVAVNLATLTLGGKDSINNEYYDVKYVIKNGKVIKNGAKAPGSKALTDSLYFQVEFADDPGTAYTLAGYKKTGFLEDEQ